MCVFSPLLSKMGHFTGLMVSNQKMLEKRPPLKFNFTYWEGFSGLFQNVKYRYFHHFVSGQPYMPILPRFRLFPRGSRPFLWLLQWSVWYKNVPLVNGKLVGRFRIKFQDDQGSLEQDPSNQSVLYESQYLGLTKTFTVGFKHLGFQKFQLLKLSTFQGQEDDVSISSLAPLQLLQTVLGR